MRQPLSVKMRDGDDTHFFTERGALCGTLCARQWTTIEASTTCLACRELIEARAQFEAEASASHVVLLGRFRGGP